MVEVAGTEGPATRHTTATLMLVHGVHPKLASGYSVDSTIAITVDLYSPARQAMHRQAARILDALLRKMPG